MNSMMAAIKAKRGYGKEDNQEGMKHEMVEEKMTMGEAGDLKSLVESLDENQKQELLSLLSEGSKDESTDVEKGGPTPNEKKIVAQKSSEENDGLSEEESDGIAMSMVGRDDQRRNEQGAKPLNLAQRARMYAADKLTKKGKI